MATHGSAPNMASFLSQSQIVLEKKHGFNAESLGLLARLVHNFGLTGREVRDAATHLGLSRAEAKQIILAANVPDTGGVGGLIGLLVVVVLLLGVSGVGIWYAMNLKKKPSDNNADQTAKITTEKNKKPNQNEPKSSTGPEKNKTPSETLLDDPRLIALVRDVQRKYPGRKALFEPLKVADPTKRTTGWKQMLAKLEELARPDATSDLDPLQEVLVGFYAREPHDANAMLIRQKLINMMPPKAGTETGECGRAFWALEVCALILKEPKTPAPRAKRIREDLQGVLGVDVQNAKGTALSRFYGKKLAERFLAIMEDLQKTEKTKAFALRFAMTPWVSKHLDPIEQRAFQEKMQLAFNDPVKPNPMPPEKKEPTDPPRKTIPEPPKKTEPKKIEPKKTEPKKPTPEPEPEDARVVNWRAFTKQVLGKPKPTEPEKLLGRTTDLAFMATLGATLTQKQTSKFDALASNPPSLKEYMAKVKTETKNVGEEPAAPTLPDGLDPGQLPAELTDQEAVAAIFQYLRPGAKFQNHRLAAIRILAVNERAKELNTQQAELVARYFLSIKAEPRNPEFAALQLLPFLVGKFDNLSLAFADVIDERPTTRIIAQHIATQILRKRVELPEKEWQAAFRKELLQASLGEAPRVLKADGIQLILRDLYRLRAAMHGLKVGADVEKSSEVVKQLIDHCTNQIDSSKLNPGAKAKFAMLPARVQAIDYAASNDLQRLALMQQAWLHLLAIKVAQDHPAKWEAATEICHEYGTEVRNETIVLAQLWQGERHLVRMRALMLSREVPTEESD